MLQDSVVVPEPVTEFGVLHVRPVGVEAETVNVTMPVNPPDGEIVIEDTPWLVARIAAGVTAPAEMLKSGPGTVTGTLTVRVRVFGKLPVMPVTSTVNPLLGNGLQLTERTAATAKLSVQPDGTVPADRATLPWNPLTGVAVIADVPATPAVVRLIGVGLADRLKS